LCPLVERLSLIIKVVIALAVLLMLVRLVTGYDPRDTAWDAATGAHCRHALDDMDAFTQCVERERARQNRP
jgi:hypothetical protein